MLYSKEDVHKRGDFLDRDCIWAVDEIRKFIREQKIRFIYINRNVIFIDDDSGIFIEDIPYDYGIYIITTISEKRYIGATLCEVHKRLRSHFLGYVTSTNIREPIKKIEVYITKDKDDVLLLEDELIFVLKPELNIFGKKNRKEVKDQEIISLFDSRLITFINEGYIEIAIEDGRRLTTKSMLRLRSDLLKQIKDNDKWQIILTQKGKKKKNLWRRKVNK